MDMKKGKNNLITDVKGVKVGHCTLSQGDIQTGVTVILPHEHNVFQNKYIAASHVINGFGKTTGLIQINELGTLESPIALTNTLSVGIVQQAIVKYMLSLNKDIGATTGTINVVVGECNDMTLNDIRQCTIEEKHVYQAIENANTFFEQGAVGAGRGMCCFEMKGGIGSSSRMLTLDDYEYTIGVLVLSNFGLMNDFIPFSLTQGHKEQEQGSIMIIIACDIPLTSRQLQRVCKRMSIPLGRLGSYMGNGSGDIVIAFSSANEIPHVLNQDIMDVKCVHENCMDKIFRGAIEACEEAILNSLKYAKTTIGKNGNIVYSREDIENEKI